MRFPINIAPERLRGFLPYQPVLLRRNGEFVELALDENDRPWVRCIERPANCAHRVEPDDLRSDFRAITRHARDLMAVAR